MKSLSRHGITLIEVLVILGILAALIGFLLPAIQQIREAALRAKSSNSIRQLTLSVHQWADQRDGRLPSIDAEASLHPKQHSAAYLNVHQSIAKLWGLPAPKTGFYNPPVPVFVSPADPSPREKDLEEARGTSYPANAQAFGLRRRLLHTSFPDGLSQTIFFAERYANCSGLGARSYASWIGPGRPTFADGGPNLGTGASEDVYPITSGNPPVTQPSVPGLTFQVRPLVRPHWNGIGEPPQQPPTGGCDQFIPQTPHLAGMLIGFGDGSSRSIRRGVAPEVFWALVTPSGGEVGAAD